MTQPKTTAIVEWLGEFFCHHGHHKWVDCSIKWIDGGPGMEWWMCDRCGILHPAVDGDKWDPFTVEKDNLKTVKPKPITGPAGYPDTG